MSELSPQSDPTGRSYELLYHRIQSQLTPDAVVLHNQFIKDVNGIIRQFDVTIEQTIGILTTLTVVECRDKSRPLKVGEVDEFVTKMRSVRAHFGVMVSARGFSKDARKAAHTYGIRLLTLTEAKLGDWNSVVGDGQWVQFVKCFAKNWEIKGLNTESDRIVPLDVSSVIHLDGPDGPNAMTTTEAFWDGFPDDEYGHRATCVLHPLDGCTMATEVNGRLIALAKIGYVVDMDVRVFPVSLEFAGGKVITRGGKKTIVFRHLHSQGIDWGQVMATQPGIPITPEQAQEIKDNATFMFPLRRVKRFVRIELTQTNPLPALPDDDDL